MSVSKIGLFVSGPKGLAFLKGILVKLSPVFVVSYRQESPSCTYDEILKLAASAGIPCIERKEFAQGLLETVDFAFVAGWQFLIRGDLKKLAVFHDSLLPKYRGFAPTVSALIQGETQLGVTLIRPVAGMDEGPIFKQERIDIHYPMKIEAAYKLLGEAYVKIGWQMINGLSIPYEQDHSLATYSIWRDEEDYQIDWSWDANKISRFIDALGPPYDSARTWCDGIELKILEVEVLPDVNFIERVPGKMWAINPAPVVVTGLGLITILRALDMNGSEYAFKKLRTRFKNRP